MRILGIAGSLRAGSYNRALLAAAAELAPEGVRIEPWERLREVPPYDADEDTDERRPESVRDLKRALTEADGVLIATPEYTYGIPGVLKNALDWASRPGYASPLARKPAGMMGASGGAIGTARAQMHLREVLYASLVRVMPHRGVLVGGAKQKFADGRLTDEPTREFLASYLRELADFVRQQNATP